MINCLYSSILLVCPSYLYTKRKYELLTPCLFYVDIHEKLNTYTKHHYDVLASYWFIQTDIKMNVKSFTNLSNLCSKRAIFYSFIDFKGIVTFDFGVRGWTPKEAYPAPFCTPLIKNEVVIQILLDNE